MRTLLTILTTLMITFGSAKDMMVVYYDDGGVNGGDVMEELRTAIWNHYKIHIPGQINDNKYWVKISAMPESQTQRENYCNAVGAKFGVVIRCGEDTCTGKRDNKYEFSVFYIDEDADRGTRLQEEYVFSRDFENTSTKALKNWVKSKLKTKIDSVKALADVSRTKGVSLRLDRVHCIQDQNYLQTTFNRFVDYCKTETMETGAPNTFYEDYHIVGGRNMTSNYLVELKIYPAEDASCLTEHCLVTATYIAPDGTKQDIFTEEHVRGTVDQEQLYPLIVKVEQFLDHL